MFKAKRIALVDCNNFYVSCERLFRPDLRIKPVAVLSNNDGCIVARSQEVKDLGIKMATPVYQVEHLIKQHQIQMFSSNYALYADISSRVMSLLDEFSPNVEVYSIDESFLDLTGIADQKPLQYGRRIKTTIWRTTGIPVCVGMGPTKTLAKLANFAAKKWKKIGAVLDLCCPLRRERLMRLVPVNEVWGIGSRIAQRLNQLGIITAWDLCCQPADKIQAQFNVVVARTVLELNGVSCLSLDEATPAKQQIVCSRSFKKRLTEFADLVAALIEFCSRAAEKLRSQHSLAGSVTVFIRTNPFNPHEPQYQRSASWVLSYATQDTRQIAGYARQLLEQIYRYGYRYQKCGVLLGHLQPELIPGQLDLFAYAEAEQKSAEQTLMQTLDQINKRFPHAVALASCGLEKRWQYQVQQLSRGYTTHWDELAKVKCG
jgi:DNA polymerase V